MPRRAAPARIYRITPEGQSSTIFEPQELQVQTLVVDKNGVLYAATNPDGKVYKIEPPAEVREGKNPPASKASPAAPWNSSVYFDPATKYIWDLALDDAGNLYVATGDHGEIFGSPPKGSTLSFSRATRPTSACWLWIRRAT